MEPPRPASRVGVDGGLERGDPYPHPPTTRALTRMGYVTRANLYRQLLMVGDIGVQALSVEFSAARESGVTQRAVPFGRARAAHAFQSTLVTYKHP